MADIIHIEEPLLRGILKVAPLKSTYSGPARNVTTNDMLQPLRDIIDICGTNPSSIEFSTNSQSSEKSGRTSSLQMHKDLLGRVRTIDMSFELLKREQYQNLNDFFMEMTEDSNLSNIISVYDSSQNGSSSKQQFVSSSDVLIYCKLFNRNTGWRGVINKVISSNDGVYDIKLDTYFNSSGETPSDSDITALKITVNSSFFTIETLNGFTYSLLEVDTGNIPVDANSSKYTIWYYIEVMLPESDVPIKEIVYIGDSGFTSLGTFYKVDTEIVRVGNDQYMEKKLTNVYVKNLKVPMIAKNAKSMVRYGYVG